MENIIDTLRTILSFIMLIILINDYIKKDITKGDK